MILKSTRIIWKLKEGTVLPYGPAQAAFEESNASEVSVSVKSESLSEVPFQKQNYSEGLNQTSEMLNAPASNAQNTPDSEVVTEVSAACTDNDVSSETCEDRVEQTYPDSINPHLVNPANTNPIVEGGAVNTSSKIQNFSARWQSLPYKLRPKRADVFVDMQSSVDYINSLVDFLKKKGLDVKEYNDEVRYLPSDIILADASRLIDAGTVLVLQRGKRYIWEALLKEFGARLNGN